MTIRFEEEMGMIPVLRGFETDSSQLPTELQQGLEEAVGALPTSPSAGDDRLRDAGSTRLTVDGRTYAMRRWEIPEEAKPLLDYLRSQAKPVPLR